MAYTYYEIDPAFNKDETHPAGFDYVTAEELVKNVVETGQGRFYFDEAGNAVYESRFHREAP
jgi:hypothetical protein